MSKARKRRPEAILGLMAAILSAGLVWTGFSPPSLGGAEAASAKAGHRIAPKGGARKKSSASAKSKRDKAIENSVFAGSIAGRYSDCAAFRDDHDRWITSSSIEGLIASGLGKRLADVDMEKGEYETTAEWMARAERIASLFVGNSHRMTFLVDVPDDEQHYDADSEVLTVSVPKGSPRVSTNHISGVYLPIWTTEKKVSSTLGRTRMGVRFRYESWIRYEQFLAIDDSQFATAFAGPAATKYSPDTSVKLKIPRDQAIGLRGHLQIAILAAFVPPFADSEDDDDVASLDDPVELYTRSEVWSVEPRCAYLYDSRSHSILHTYYEGDVDA